MSLIRCKNGHSFSERRHGVICPYCNISTTKSEKTLEDPQGQYADLMYLSDTEVLKPVTGWIVCVDGPSKGKDYRIVAEKNFIGRNPDMDIRIIGDEQISPKNHAIIVYDYEKNKSILLPGDAHGLVHIFDDNDKWEVVLEPKELQAGDKIKLGESQFIFVPLCGEGGQFVFSWKK